MNNKIEGLIRDFKSEKDVMGQIAILGAACVLPGAVSSPDEFACVLRAGVDCISEITYARWDVSEYYDPDASTGMRCSPVPE